MVMDTAPKTEDKSKKPEDKAKAPPKATAAPPPTKEPPPAKTYTQAEVDKVKEDAVHDALMKRGRDWKTLEDEKNSLSNQLKELQSTKSKLEIQLDELANENPDKFNVVKKYRELDETERRLNQEREEHNSRIRQERETMDAERQTHQAAIQMALSAQREIDAFDIAEEFQGGDAARLKDLAEIMGKNSKEDIRKIAETLWTRKDTAEANPPLKLDSGLTIGGLSEETIRKNYRDNPEDPKARNDYFAWRRKKGI